MLVASVDDEQVYFHHSTLAWYCLLIPVRLRLSVRSRALGGQTTGEDDLPAAEQELRTTGEH